MESEDKGKFPFLDVLVTRDAESGIVQTAAYPPIQTGTSTMSLTTQPMWRPESFTLYSGDLDTFATVKYQQQMRLRHIQKVFGNNGYPTNFIRRAMNPKPTTESTQEVLATVTIPYVKGISESIRQILSKENIFRSRTAVRRLRIPQHGAKGVVYCIPCQDCDKVYVGEAGRTLNVRQKEHKRHLFNGNTEDSAVATHAHHELHDIDWENTFVLDHDQEESQRSTIKRTTSIRTVAWQLAIFGYQD